ncbi:MAG: hypothetical protein M3R68_00430 [Acidobacteriota bacterium]|nr:hypothetical protein [Acidobacteriota bacterium]
MGLRDNKLVRSSLRVKNKSVVDDQPTVEEHLSRLEEDIRRLKIEFDVYFNGASKRPPYDTKNRVETIIKRLFDDRTLTYAQRFQYNSLASRYNAFRDLWRRTLKGREEGRDPAAAARAAKQADLGPFDRATFVCANAHKDVGTIKELYDSLLVAKRRCGESTVGFSFPRFHRLIATKADTLKERLGCEQVRFSVDVEDGHVSFKAKAEED